MELYMWKSSSWQVLALALACVGLLSSCFWGDDDPPYPPIDKEKLVGCWVAELGLIVREITERVAIRTQLRIFLHQNGLVRG
jgi:hypothetical protein